MTVAISMTTFIDYVSATSTAKITCIKRAKAFYEGSAPYEATSFYLPLKNAFRKAFEAGGDFVPVANCIDGLADAKKLKSYTANGKGMKKWMAGHAFEWVGTYKRVWSASGLEVSVNPELAVLIDERRYFIKLYMKAQPLRTRAVDPMLHILGTTHGLNGSVGILDVQRSRLLSPKKQIPNVEDLLRAEAAAFVSLWGAM